MKFWTFINDTINNMVGAFSPEIFMELCLFFGPILENPPEKYVDFIITYKTSERRDESPVSLTAHFSDEKYGIYKQLLKHITEGKHFNDYLDGHTPIFAQFDNRRFKIKELYNSNPKKEKDMVWTYELNELK